MSIPRQQRQSIIRSLGLRRFALTLACLLLTNCSHSPLSQAQRLMPEPQAELVEPQTPDFKRAAEVNVELAVAYLNQGNKSRAKEKLLRAEQLTPDLAVLHTAWGLYYESVADTAKARKAYESSIRLANGDGQILSGYAAFLCRNDEFDQANHFFERALSDKNMHQTTDVYENAGLCSQQAGQLQLAEHYFFKAIQLDESRSRSWLGLSHLAFEANQLGQAKSYLDKVHALTSPSPQSLFLGIAVAQRQGDKNTEANYKLLLRGHFPDIAWTQHDHSTDGVT